MEYPFYVPSVEKNKYFTIKIKFIDKNVHTFLIQRE